MHTTSRTLSVDSTAASLAPSPACWRVQCDGSAVPNPGRMGLGALVTAPDGTRHVLSQTASESGCNNEAELRALMAGLRLAQAQGASMVRAHSDNRVVVDQLGGTAVRPVARLAPLFDEARQLLASFAQAELCWIPRHRNGEADALARAALGMAPKPAPRPGKKKRRR